MNRSGMAQEGGIVRKGMQDKGLMRNSGGFLPTVFSEYLRNATSKEIFQKANESGFGNRIPEGITVAQKGGTWNLGFGGWAADRGAVQAGGRVTAGWLRRCGNADARASDGAGVMVKVCGRAGRGCG